MCLRDSLSSVTVGQVSLFGGATDITGFEIKDLTVTSSGYIGGASYKLLEFSSLSVTVSQLKALKAANGSWGLDTATATTVSLSATTASLLPNESDLTASLSGFSAAVNVSTGAFTATGSERLNVRGCFLYKSYAADEYRGDELGSRRLLTTTRK